MTTQKNIDGGRAFDWGRTSADYAKYRDIYPPEFYQKLLDRKLCVAGQRVLDLGTGTGVLPRNLARYGASFVGVDSSENQIAEAKKLAAADRLHIDFQVCPAEEIDFPDHSFDIVTACQCFFYFDADLLLPRLARILNPGGKLAVLYMAWLPSEDPIAGASEELILRYHPGWTGAGETRRPIEVRDTAGLFRCEESLIYDLRIPFTRESWSGRIRACRGVGASLPEDQLCAFEKEHHALLERIAPETFFILHYAALSILTPAAK